MRRILYGLCLGFVVALAPVASAAAAPGDLDTSFGTNGIIVLDTAVVPDSVAIQSDGKIIAIWGTTLERYMANGEPDPSFGDAGTVELDEGSGAFSRLMIQPATDRILVQQATDRDTRYDGGGNTIYHQRIVALTRDGALDLGFGDDGVLTTPDDGLYVPLCYEMAPNGSLVGGGYALQNNGDLAVFKCTPDGALDTSFGTAGVITEALASQTFDAVCALGILRSGKILLAGEVHTDGFYLRLLPDGSHDQGFHHGSIFIRPNAFGSPVEMGRIVELSDGDLLLGWRLLSGIGNGMGHGIRRLSPDCSEEHYVQLPGAGAMLADGSLLAAGIVNNRFPTYDDFVIARFTPSLLPDETFAPGGTVVKDFGSPSDFVSCAIRPDGKILVAGVTSGLSASGRGAATQGVMFQLQGGSRTNLRTKLTRSGRSSASLKLRAGLAKWPTSAKLTCNGTRVGSATLVLMRSANGRSWSKVAKATTDRTGSASVTVKLKRRGTSYYRWSFAGTKSYRKAASTAVKVVVR